MQSAVIVPVVALIVLARTTTPFVALVACASAAVMLGVERRRTDVPWLPAFVALACVVASHAWLVTQGTFAWNEREMLGSAYDSLARSLRHGSVAVRSEDIQWEAWQRGGPVTMYFGPFPAMLRMLPDLLVPSRHGLWSRPSSFLAVLLSLAAIVSIARRQLADNERIDARGRTILFLATLAAVGLGSPLVVVGSLANLYHEAILWGLCAALWGIFFALGVLRDDARAWGSLALLSAASGAALLSRVTFGLPLYALASGLALWLLVHQVRRDGRPLLSAAGRVALVLLPAIAAGVFQLWYNHARFGSPFEFAPFEAKGVESAFQWSRMPSGALAYFGISPENFSSRVPFLTFALPSVFRPELYLDLTNLLISPLLVSPWIVVALAGGGMLRGRPGERRLLALCAVPFAVQCLLILAYYWLAYRFTAEFLPLGVWFLAAYLRNAGTGTGTGVARLLSPRVFALVTAFSVLATVTSLFHFQSQWWAYPESYRRHISRTFEALDERLGLVDRGPGIGRLPR